MLKQADHPLVLFISYEHSVELICRKIIDKLKERGHQVWFDSDSIHRAEDWRRNIEREIEGSHAVVLCMSKRAMCDPGVCLDELNIAMRLKGDSICPVLLDSEQVMELPEAVRPMRWIDMSDWWDRLGSLSFDAWFDEKMGQLIGMIEAL